MARSTAADFDQELLILFDAYVHGDIDRRAFLERASRFAVGGVTAVGLLAALSPDFAGRIGVVGFCYGGGIAHMLATQLPDLAAAVPFYGNLPPVQDAAKVKAPLLIHFAGIDERINAAWPAYEAALKAAGVRYTAYQYPATQHGFHNDTTPRYDTNAAQLAWDRTLGFFKQSLT